MSEFSAGLRRAWDTTQPRGQWHEITQADAEYCCDVLPPILFPGGFAVSEAANHNAEGEAVYLCVRPWPTRGLYPQTFHARLASIREIFAEQGKANGWAELSRAQQQAVIRKFNGEG